MSRGFSRPYHAENPGCLDATRGALRPGLPLSCVTAAGRITAGRSDDALEVGEPFRTAVHLAGDWPSPERSSQTDAVAVSASGAGTRTPRKRTNAASAPSAANAIKAANPQW